MKEYEVAVILWDDHRYINRDRLPINPDDLFSYPTLSVGLILGETEKALVLVHDIERFDDRDDSTYTVILKSTVVGKKVYGKIELDEIRK